MCWRLTQHTPFKFTAFNTSVAGSLNRLWQRRLPIPHLAFGKCQLIVARKRGETGAKNIATAHNINLTHEAYFCNLNFFVFLLPYHHTFFMFSRWYFTSYMSWASQREREREREIEWEREIILTAWYSWVFSLLKIKNEPRRVFKTISHECLQSR